MELALNEINDLVSDINLNYDKTLYLIDHIEKIKLLRTAFSNDTDFILLCKQLEIVETANIISGTEQFDYSSKETILAGLEFNITAGIKRVEQIFKWLWEKIKELFTKLKKFIIDTFNKLTNVDKYEQIKEQTLILDQLHQSKTKETSQVLKPIYEETIKILNTKVDTISFPVLSQSVDIALNILHQAFQKNMFSSDDDIVFDSTAWAFGTKMEVPKYTEDPEIKELVLNLLRNAPIKFYSLPFSEVLDLGKYLKPETFELNQTYIKFYESARYMSTNLENVLAMIEKRFKNVEHFLVGNLDNTTNVRIKDVDPGKQKHVMFVQKIITPVVALVNKCIVTQTLAIHKVITEFEKHIDDSISKRFSKEYSVYSNPNPVMLKKTYSFSGFDCYSAINPSDIGVSTLENRGTHVAISMLNPRMFIYLDRHVTMLTDSEIKNWIIAHEVSHMVNNHPFMMRMLKIINQFRYFRNKNINDANMELERLRKQSKTNEFVADEYAYNLYGLDTSIKALTWYASTIGVNVNKDTNTHASINERIVKLKQLEQEKTK